MDEEAEKESEGHQEVQEDAEGKTIARFCAVEIDR